VTTKEKFKTINYFSLGYGIISGKIYGAQQKKWNITGIDNGYVWYIPGFFYFQFDGFITRKK
jgi:hypothetical protein